MNISINRVRVKNFRSLCSVETYLGDVTLLLGTNNSGKTSFLRALTVGLTSDRKFISQDDLFIDGSGNSPAERKITIDIEIIPSGSKTFPDEWAQVFGDDIQLDAGNNEFFAYRTIIDFFFLFSETLVECKIALDNAGISIPFPQREIKILNKA